MAKIIVFSGHGEWKLGKDEFVAPAIRQADSVLFIRAACRAINLKPVGGGLLGVNVLQR